jgi:hypothetical protein
MANYMEVTNLDARKFVPVSSRYSDSTVIYYTERKLLTFPLYKKKPVDLSGNNRYAVITGSYEYRPDLVSQMAYGTVDFWWKIMEANGLKDIWEFKAGLNILIPGSIFG